MDLPLRDRKAIDGRVPVTRDEWRKKHRDFKSTDGVMGRSMMGMERNGGSALYPVVIVDESLVEQECEHDWQGDMEPDSDSCLYVDRCSKCESVQS